MKIAPVKIIFVFSAKPQGVSSRGYRNRLGEYASPKNSSVLKKVRKSVFCQRNSKKSSSVLAGIRDCGVSTASEPGSLREHLARVVVATGSNSHKSRPDASYDQLATASCTDLIAKITNAAPLARPGNFQKLEDNSGGGLVIKTHASDGPSKFFSTKVLTGSHSILYTRQFARSSSRAQSGKNFNDDEQDISRIRT